MTGTLGWVETIGDSVASSRSGGGNAKGTMRRHDPLTWPYGTRVSADGATNGSDSRTHLLRPD